MQALYKKPIDGVFDYITDGIPYLYTTCTEDAIDAFVADGWITEFSQLKGEQNEKTEKQGQETKEVLTPKRGRPKAQ